MSILPLFLGLGFILTSIVSFGAYQLTETECEKDLFEFVLFCLTSPNDYTKFLNNFWIYLFTTPGPNFLKFLGEHEYNLVFFAFLKKLCQEKPDMFGAEILSYLNTLKLPPHYNVLEKAVEKAFIQLSHDNVDYISSFIKRSQDSQNAYTIKSTIVAQDTSLNSPVCPDVRFYKFAKNCICFLGITTFVGGLICIGVCIGDTNHKTIVDETIKIAQDISNSVD